MNQSTNGLNDNEMDGLFREAHAETTPIPAFEESYWNEMEALLPAKKKKIFVWWWFPISAAILAGFIWMGFLFNSSENSTKKELVQLNIKLDEKRDNVQKNTSNNTIKGLNTDSPESISPVKSNRSSIENEYKFNLFNSQSENGLYKSELNSKLNETHAEQQNLDYTTESKNSTLSVDSEESETERLSTIDWRVSLYSIPATTVVNPEKNRETSPYYFQFGLSLGQSYQKNVATKNQLVYGTSFSFGLRKQLSNLELTAGLQARLESYNNLQFNENTSSYDANGNVIVGSRLTHVRQMISLEFPLSMGIHLNRHLVSFNLNPGIQLFYAGNRLETIDNVEQSREKVAGSVQYSKTVTMEFGFSYFYQLNQNWMLGCGINADILRPFNPNFYDGFSTQFPLNGQVMIRKAF